MANARMIEKVKDADVVITNPEHFAVALNYEPTSDEAPHLLAKGIDAMAHKTGRRQMTTVYKYLNHRIWPVQYILQQIWINQFLRIFTTLSLR